MKYGNRDHNSLLQEDIEFLVNITINFKLTEQSFVKRRLMKVTNENTYTIEQLKVSPININMEDHESIKHTISKLADGPIKGETEIEVFKIFASALERKFGAEISTFNPPSTDYKHWKIYLPKDGNFDATPSRFSVSFYIKRNDNP